jgi:transposase-like protein
MLSAQTIWKKVMTKKTRRRYTAEFKAAAVARLDEPGETLSSVAQALGVAATQVKTWRLEQQAAGTGGGSVRSVTGRSRQPYTDFAIEIAYVVNDVVMDVNSEVRYAGGGAEWK